MRYIFRDPKLGAFFGLSTDYVADSADFAEEQGLISIFWNKSAEAFRLQIDAVPYTLAPYQITTVTFLQKLSFNSPQSLLALCFNREFYCIRDHDHEVSCNGILFFGTNKAPIITLDEEEQHKFELLYQILLEEFETRDQIQGEMLRMLLKRWIIKATRLAKEQLMPEGIGDMQIDLIRRFNVLVDMHFREKKMVADYADMLYKSPKTLSNMFSKYRKETPLQVIHGRIITEAKRQLLYTDKTVKEIAYELGYEDDAVFHKLFKKYTTQTPQQFKMKTKNSEREE